MIFNFIKEQIRNLLYYLIYPFLLVAVAVNCLRGNHSWSYGDFRYHETKRECYECGLVQKPCDDQDFFTKIEDIIAMEEARENQKKEEWFRNNGLSM